MKNVLALLLVFASVSVTAQEEQDTHYVARRASVALLATPAPDAVLLARLTPDEPVSVLGESGDFINVRTSSGMEGWLAAEDVTATQPAGEQLDAAQARVAELEGQVASLQRQLRNTQAQARQASSALSNSQEDTEAELASLREQLTAATQELETLRGRNAALESEIAEYELAEQTRQMLARTNTREATPEQASLAGYWPLLTALAAGLALVGFIFGYGLKSRRIRKRLHGLEL